MKNDLYKYLNQYKEIYSHELILNSTGSILSNQSYFSNFDNYISSIDDPAIYLLPEFSSKFILANKNKNSNIIFIGEGLSNKKGLQGLPFIGKSGNLFDKMLAAIQLTRNDIYIFNILEKKTFNGMNFLSNQIKNCNDYLINELKLINPSLIVSLGKLSTMTLLGNEKKFNNLKSKMHKYEDIDFLITYHPEDLLLNTDLKKNAWQDFKLIRNYI